MHTVEEYSNGKEKNLKGKGPKNHFSRKRNTTAKMRNVKKIIIPDCDDNSEEFLEEIMEAILPENFEELEREPLEGNSVLVQYVIDGKSQIFYIGEVTGSRDDDNNYEVNFLRIKSTVGNKFIKPEIEDRMSVHEKQIKMILPKL
jgi:hypothetical protein